jgi:hypothetical protein
VPIIGMSRTPSELGFARVFAWGADDLVPLGATPALERRLVALLAATPSDQRGFGQAVVAEGTTQRRALLGRVLVHAGYDVKFAVDRGSVELYASQAETRIVVISATLGDPRKLIEAAARAGGLATWIVTAEARSVARLASGLAGLDRVVVTSTAGSPEDILFLANEIVFGKGHRQREWRALYGSPVAFRPLGATTDEYGFTYDVSPGGLYVRSLLPCESEDVEVDLRPPERDERVRLLGKVVRRFAFGSGSVASAPPGFGVKVTGPSSPALKLWIEACRAYVEKAGSGSPPEALQPSIPAQKASDSASSMPALAVPGPNLTIESVVLPLPNERTDVAGLLLETLGEEAPPEAGTRPVTVDAETGGVREERPSEYGMSLEGTEATLPPPPDAKTLQPLAEPAPARSPSTRPPLPVPVAPQQDDHDDQTSVYERSEVEAFAQRKDREAAEALAHNATPFRPPSEPAEPITLVPDPDPEPEATVPMPPPVVRAPPPPVISPPRGTPAAAPPAAAPVTSPAAFAGTVAMPRSPVVGLGGTIVLPAPAPPPPARVEPPVPAAPEPSKRAERIAEPPVEPTKPVESDEVVEPPMPAPPAAVAEPPAPSSFSPYAAPSVLATSRGFPSQTAPVESHPRDARPAEVREGVPPPSEPGEKPARRSSVLLVVIAVAALGLGVGGGVLVLQRSKAKPAPEPQPTAAPVTAPQAPAEPAIVPPPPATTAAPNPSDEAPPSAAPSTTAAAEAPPEAASAAAPPASAPPVTPDAPAAVPPPDFDLEKLPGDRAALLVRSSAQARVFVHGRDYGETNHYLLTTCGIRFVRLGRGFNDFIEPGRSIVVKCGRLTEVSIEPDR